jgi:5-(hydroxymethyl)furfural/furfural oxidase
MPPNRDGASLLGVPELRPFYDVIVVGAGTAGAVVAQTLARLLPNKSILVIESGPNLDPFLPVALEPANSPNLFVAQSDGRRQQPPQAFTRTSALRSGELQVPAKTGLRFPNYVQGRGWGGSGAINGLVCQPGHPADYDRWAHEYGCTGWSWDDIGPVLAALQSQLFVSTPSMYQLADRSLIAAHASLGPEHANGLRLEPAALTLRQPNRVAIPTAATSMARPASAQPPLQRKLLGLDPAGHYPNLHRVFELDVVRILTEGTTVRGVQLAGGTEIESNHVIVSAGAIGSPVLLQRSGIGRPSVGQNLHDHASISVTLQLRDMPSAAPDKSPEASSPGALTPTNVAIASSNHIQVLPVSPLPDDPTLGVWMASPFQAIHGRGSVSTQTNGTALVQFNSFTDERDRSELRSAARLLGQLLEQLPISPGSQFCTKPVDPHTAEQLRALNDIGLDTWILNNQGSYYHAAGTCRMGAADDPGSVVDSSCAILGWSNISVIDASIFPNLPMANPYLPTVAVAQLAASRRATYLSASQP